MDSRAHNEGNQAKPAQSSHQHPAPTKSELMSSAKLLGEAAKAKFHNDPGAKPVDKAELAGAAADLLNAASHYGKFEEDKGMGKYVGKAEDYLHKYHTSHSPTAAASGTDHHSTSDGAAAGGGHANSSGHSGSKYGEYAKMAGDFLKKR